LVQKKKVKAIQDFFFPNGLNYYMQLKPTIIPKWTRDKNTQKSSSLPFRQDEDISCPHGTVIIKRTTLEDLIQIQRLKYLGVKYTTSKDKDFLNMTGRHVRKASCSHS